MKKALMVMMKRVKEISLFDIGIFVKVQQKEILKAITCANYHMKKETEDTYEIKIPNIRNEEKKKVFLVLTLDDAKIKKPQKLNLLKSNNFVFFAKVLE